MQKLISFAIAGFLCLFLMIVVELSAIGQDRRSERQAPNRVTLTLGEGWGEPHGYIPPVSLPDGRLLVTAVDILYMMDGEKVVWKYGPIAPLTAQPVFRADVNEVAFVGLDLTFGRLDATSGELKWHASTVGRATFSEVFLYEDGYLVVVDMSNYATSADEVIPNRLHYWSADERKDSIWTVDIPQGSKLLIHGRRLLAVTQDRKNIILEELTPPSARRMD